MRADRKKIKFSSRCAIEGCRRRALKWANGSYDSYCRIHKREHAAAYMRRRRAEARA